MSSTPRSKRRLSGVFSPTPARKTPLVRLSTDGEERRKRRRSGVQELRRRSLRLFSPARGGTPEDRGANPQILEIIQNVISMSQRNKINIKNSWDVPMPMSEAAPFEEGGVTNFQRAAGALDAGVKIYGYRVDDTYRRSVRVLEALARGDDLQAPEDGTEGSGPRVASRKAGVASTLESNMRSITSEPTSAPTNHDPSYRHIARAFDGHGARATLLASLSMTHGVALALDASMVPGAVAASSSLHSRTAASLSMRRASGNGFLSLDGPASPIPVERSHAAGPDTGARGGGGRQHSLGAFADLGLNLGAAGDTSAVGDMTHDTDIDIGDLRAEFARVCDDAREMVLCPSLSAMYTEAGEGGSAPEIDASTGEEEAVIDGVAGTGGTAHEDNDAVFGPGPSQEDGVGAGAGAGAGWDDGYDSGADSVGDMPPMPDFSDPSDTEQAAPPVVAGADLAPPAAVLEAMLLGSTGSDYAFFDAARLRGWAGPRHWRFSRPLPLPVTDHRDDDDGAESADGQPPRHRARRTGTTAAAAAAAAAAAGGEPVPVRGQRRRAARREAFVVDFTAPPPDPEAEFRPPPRSRQATTVSEGTISRRAPRVLPVDLHYTLDDAVRLFARPAALARRLQSAPCGVVDVAGVRAAIAALPPFATASSAAHPASRLDAALRARYRAAAGGKTPARDRLRAALPLGAMAPPAAMPMRGFDDDVAAAAGGEGENEDDFDMPAMPDMYSDDDDDDEVGMGGNGSGRGGFLGTGISLHDGQHAFGDDAEHGAGGLRFTKIAKKVDVRRLKSAILGSLENALGPLPLTKDAGNGAENATGRTKGRPGTASLRDIVSHVGETLGPDATVPYYFICALHLANERGLTLEGVEDMGDVRVSKC